MASLKVKEVFCLIYATILLITGILLIGFSVVLCYKLVYHFTFVPTGAIGPFIVLFLLGIAHILLTWLAVKGPTKEHDFHIILFMIITILLLISECAVGIWSMILRDEVDVEAVLLMTQSFKVIKDDFNKNVEWSRLQRQLKCCGLNGVADYTAAKGSIPVSCYEGEIGSNGTYYEVGCKNPLLKHVKWILVDGAIIGFLSCIYQGLGIFTFYTFFKSLRQERKDRISRRQAIQRDVLYQNDNNRQSLSASAGPPSPPVPPVAGASTQPPLAPPSAPPTTLPLKK